eukprot:g1216.t1
MTEATAAAMAAAAAAVATTAEDAPKHTLVATATLAAIVAAKAAGMDPWVAAVIAKIAGPEAVAGGYATSSTKKGKGSAKKPSQNAAQQRKAMAKAKIKESKEERERHQAEAATTSAASKAARDASLAAAQAQNVARRERRVSAMKEEFYGKELVLADRDMAESDMDNIFATAKDENVSFLVAGDPFRGSAVSLNEFFTRARALGVQVEVIQNVSLEAAVGSCGLKGDKFGMAAKIDTWGADEDSKPDSFFDVIKDNRRDGKHTLCVLDMKVEEPNLSDDASDDASGEAELLDVDLGEPPFTLVICGETDSDEDELLQWHRAAEDLTEHSPADEDCELEVDRPESAATGEAQAIAEARADAEAQANAEEAAILSQMRQEHQWRMAWRAMESGQRTLQIYRNL